ncbi:MAG TPA: DCC1-like thiol-disulfide oxidoreductase family protein [Bryobacteraceae bacterium]|nr:DCC1-like thiol-disulfide oxidoreductase family protein [Bryobacteraceae bacterium]
MRCLYVLYDPACGLCTYIRGWLQRQNAYLPLRLVAAGSPEARQMFPTLGTHELAVVADTGQAWIGDHAWIMCLWALRDYRVWSIRLARPSLLPFARQAFASVSRNRDALSQLLGLRSESEVQDRLREVMLPPCPVDLS